MNNDYKMQLLSPMWEERRKQILRRDNYTCQKCGKTDVMLNVHHKEYLKGVKAWEYPDEFLITLCEQCHFDTHNEQIESDTRVIHYAEVGKMYEYYHSDFFITLLCYFVDNLNKRVYLAGIDSGGGWSDIVFRDFSFNEFYEECSEIEVTDNFDSEEAYFQDSTVWSFYLFLNKDDYAYDHYGYRSSIEEIDRVRQKLLDAINRNEVIAKHYEETKNNPYRLYL